MWSSMLPSIGHISYYYIFCFIALEGFWFIFIYSRVKGIPIILNLWTWALASGHAMLLDNYCGL